MTNVLDEARDRLLELALRGDFGGARTLIMQVLRDGESTIDIIETVLAGVQYEVGERWCDNQCSIIDEHAATGVVRTALDTVLATSPRRGFSLGSVVLACAEGDWHSLASRFQAELLNANGWTVRYLGASSSADQVQTYLAHNLPTAMVVTCSYPPAFIGAARLTECAHSFGVPVIIGGRAVTPLRLAERLGADSDPTSITEIIQVLEDWLKNPPRTFNSPRLRLVGQLTNAEIDFVAKEAFAELARQLGVEGMSDNRESITTEALADIVRFACAARVIDCREVFTEFVSWIAQFLFARGVPTRAFNLAFAVLYHVISEGRVIPDRRDAMTGLAGMLR
jgi:methanogenic corrinoid protein MtbC1